MRRSMWLKMGNQRRSRSARWLVAAGAVIAAGVAVSGVGCSPAGGPESEPESLGDQSSAIQGVNLAGSNLGGANLGGMNFAGTNLGGANLGGTNLGGTNLGGANLGGANLGGNNLGGNNLGGTNLGGTNLGGTNLGGANLGGTNLGGSNLGGSNLGGTNLGGNNLGGTNLGGANLAGADSGGNIHNLTGSINGMLYSGEDLFLPKTAQCIVTGFGSTAFPKLLGQQSANANISVAVGKLPWGFANTSGGAVTLGAWEAVVWGDKTYCSFVLAVPPGTAWSGVAGFIKAVFRWNAPTTQSMSISGIKRSAAVDPTVNFSITTYTGMMNAAAKWNNGTGNVSASAFTAGELAFITSTTNNQTVMVDFASWVQDTSKNPLVLGNVSTSPLPTYSESVYTAVDNGDGTVGILIDDTAFKASSMPSGVIDSMKDLQTVYTNWKSGGGPKPIPRRCGAALDLSRALYGEPLEPGKCDSGLAWANDTCTISSQPWTAASGTTAPMNQYMQMTPSGGSYARAPEGSCTTKPVLSETYIHMWTPSYDLNRAFGGTPSSNTTNICTSSEGLAQVFDNLSTTKWCVGFSNLSPTNPVSIMYTFPGTTAYAITSYSITSANDVPTRDPRDWMLQGCQGSCVPSSDAGWVTLDTRMAETFLNRQQTKVFAFSNSTAYRQIRLRITSNYNDIVSQVAELRLFDTGGCTPQSDAAFCASYGKNCGSLTEDDNCGTTRAVSNCGTCGSGTTCAGGGVANVCGSGGGSLTCQAAYSQSNCLAYVGGLTQVSSGGHNYLCANANCQRCDVDTRCAPGGTGCPWGINWQDNGTCGSGGGSSSSSSSSGSSSSGGSSDGGSTVYYRLRNDWNSTYLYDAGAVANYSSTIAATDTSGHWQRVPTDSGYERLVNRQTGQFLNIQPLDGKVHADSTDTTWMSSQWSVAGFTASNGKYLYRIRNRWQTGQEMDIENLYGYAQQRALCDACWSSYWDLVPAP